MEGMSDGERTESEPAAAAVAESDVLRCLPGVRAMILRMTRDINLANDLTQDVMIAMVVAIREGRVKHPEALAGYVHETARHIVYAANRKMRPISVETLPEHESAWLDAPRTPLDYVEDDELRRFALEVLDELPAQRDRDLIVGFYVDGLSKAELMQRLMLAADQFDKVIFRARTRMRDRLREKMQEKHAQVRDTALPRDPTSGKSRHA